MEHCHVCDHIATFRVFICVYNYRFKCSRHRHVQHADIMIAAVLQLRPIAAAVDDAVGGAEFIMHARKAAAKLGLRLSQL